MKRILVIYFSQTGQLKQLVDSISSPLIKDKNIQLDFLPLEMEKPFPFPWPFLKFFRIFPEAVLMKPAALKPLAIDTSTQYDLIILAYQVWFLSPSIPITSFLASAEAKALLHDTPVMTVIACRNMWLVAQEKMKAKLCELNAKLVDNVVLTDACGGALSFFATPLWMLTGRKKPYSFIPKAGVAEHEIVAASRFGEAIGQRLSASDDKITQSMLKGLAAVKVDEKFIASEKIAARSFLVWSKLLSKLGGQDSLARALGLCVYVVFLIAMILTVVPITAIVKKLIAPLTRKRIAKQKAYFAQPSGE